MFSNRVAWSIVSIFLGLTTAFAQVQGTVAPGQVQGTTTVASPLFQGIVVDAKGKTVGRLVFEPLTGLEFVVRQINGIWVILRVILETGFALDNFVTYFYQSADCTGQAYLSLGGGQSTISPLGGGLYYNAWSATPIAPEIGTIAIVPPETVPSIYFAGKPASVLNINSYTVGTPFCQAGVANIAVGLPQSVPMSSLGLTPPFSVK
jgi:hypothetical protein